MGVWVYGIHYRFQHALDIFENFIVPKSQDKKPVGFEDFCSMPVLKIVIMLSAIQFYNQPFLKTHKISDKIIYGFLTPKF